MTLHVIYCSQDIVARCRVFSMCYKILWKWCRLLFALVTLWKWKNKFLLANYTRHNFCVLHAILDMHVISVNRIFYDVKEKIHDNLNHCKNNWPYHCTINLWTPSEVKRHLLTSCSEKQEDIYCLFPLLRIYKIWKKKTQVKIWECKITIGKSSFRNILQICTYYKLSLHNLWQIVYFALLFFE